MNLNELIKAYSLLENDEGELCEDWDAKMDVLGASIEKKIDNSCALIKAWEGHASAIDTEIERLKKLKASYETKADSLGKWLCYCIGDQKIDTGMHRVYARVSESVDVQDESAIPPQYVKEAIKVITSPDKNAIKADLKLGADIPGVVIKRNVSLVIK